jgi:hypothetical protein
MATLKDTVSLADQLTELTQQLHGELTDGDVDFDKMIRIADEISEQADHLATAFERVNEALTEPLQNGGSSSRSESEEGSGSESSSGSGSSSGSSSGSGSSQRAARSGSRSRSSSSRRRASNSRAKS